MNIICLCLQDDKLKAMVQKLGPSDWKYIASFIPVSLILLFKVSFGYFMSTDISSSEVFEASYACFCFA